MPAQEHSHRHQRAIFWAFSGYGTDGAPTVETFFTEIGVRWNDRKSDAMAPDGTKVTLDADLDTGHRLLPIGSIVWRGSQTDLEDLVVGTGTGTDITPPDDLTDLYAVVTNERMLDVRGRAAACGA